MKLETKRKTYNLDSKVEELNDELKNLKSENKSIIEKLKKKKKTIKELYDEIMQKDIRLKTFWGNLGCEALPQTSCIQPQAYRGSQNYSVNCKVKKGRKRHILRVFKISRDTCDLKYHNYTK